MNEVQKLAVKIYLDYVNNFLTIDALAEHYEISESLAYELYQEGKSLHNKD